MDRRDGWRIEADEAWLAAHRSDTFASMRRRLRRFGLLGEAMSNAELGPFGGAPRNPKLKIGGKAYAVVRYAQHRIAYTTIHVDLYRCKYCGRRFAEVHRVVAVRESGGRVVIGTVQMCRRCQGDSWMFRSHMPSTARARRSSRKVVL